MSTTGALAAGGIAPLAYMGLGFVVWDLGFGTKRECGMFLAKPVKWTVFLQSQVS